MKSVSKIYIKLTATKQIGNKSDSVEKKDKNANQKYTKCKLYDVTDKHTVRSHNLSRHFNHKEICQWHREHFWGKCFPVVYIMTDNLDKSMNNKYILMETVEWSENQTYLGEMPGPF